MVGQACEQLVSFGGVTVQSQMSTNLRGMELDEIFCPDVSELPPPATDHDDALEM